MFIGSTFICGLFGDPASIKLPELEKVAGELSSKPVKGMKKDKGVLDFINSQFGTKFVEVDISYTGKVFQDKVVIS